MKKKRYAKAIGISSQASDGNWELEINGSGYQADEIVRLAKRFNKPIIDNQFLAEALSDLVAGEPIPEEICEALSIIVGELEESS